MELILRLQLQGDEDVGCPSMIRQPTPGERRGSTVTRPNSMCHRIHLRWRPLDRSSIANLTGYAREYVIDIGTDELDGCKQNVRLAAMASHASSAASDWNQPLASPRCCRLAVGTLGARECIV
jgi:hypothetical protein